MKYEPWTDGYAVGFKCTAKDNSVSYVYLNPSSEDSENQPNIFVYEGKSGDPAYDAPVCYVCVGEKEK